MHYWDKKLLDWIDECDYPKLNFVPSLCGIDSKNVTSIKSDVTCKRCIKSIKK